MRRVVITGIGLVSPFGSDLEGFWSALRSGTSGAVHIDVDGAGTLGPSVGVPVTGFSAGDHVDAKARRLMAPAVTFGVAAADLAVRDSGWDLSTLDPVRLGAFVGSRGHGTDRSDLMPAVHLASETGAFDLHTFATKGLPRVNPMWLLKGLANNVLYFLSLKYNAQGMNNNISLGGVGATIAIGEAFEAIRRGYIDVSLTAGYDSALDADRIEMFGSSGIASWATDPKTASRPFDANRTGFVPGEGAASLVLETLDGARARGARIYAEILGYGSAMAPRTMRDLGPSARGFAAALTDALKQAGRTPDAVFAHGLASQIIDHEETKGLKTALGAAAARTPIPAVKSMLGNSIAGSGAVEAVAAICALGHGCVPPTVNLTDADPDCDLDYVAGTEGRPMPLETVAVNNANLGGGHAALVLGRIA